MDLAGDEVVPASKLIGRDVYIQLTAKVACTPGSAAVGGGRAWPVAGFSS